MPISIGLRGEATVAVTDANTAAALGSGSLRVFGTPAMLALMEQAACNALAAHLEPGQTSVGTHLDVSHEAATPVGLTVRAEAVVTAVDGRKIAFRVSAYDVRGPIGSGTHERCLVREDAFIERTYAKLQP